MSLTETKRKYKASFILDTRGVETPEALIEQLKEILTALESEIGSVHKLGWKDFARLTDKKHPGDFYIQIEFMGPPRVSSTLQAKLRLEKTVKRGFVEALG